ncbi:sigma-54-dependent Fis family transcriptional regulator [Aquabacterium sp. A08]|nr:sigma-54 dependent transcriptional regulator [Aquabacterium sp. A08]NIC40464.1 sigma-54-dependent Fis family transcriptional regulator [Aquabacterium sp. A08]
MLVVDDEQGMRNFLLKVLAPRCRLVATAASAEEGAEWMQAQRVDLVILDISLPGKNGVAWLKELREQGYSGEVILITAFADLDTAIEALRAGASDFILKPFRIPQILNAIKQCYDRAQLRRENYVLRRNARLPRPSTSPLVGRSDATARLRAAVERVAPMPSTVLLQGESGTGKELVARQLHARSPRAPGPFVPVNCAALAPDAMAMELFGHTRATAQGQTHARDGLFYYAQGGTLFFDEVAELPLPVQAMLLRAIEELQIRPVGSQQLLPVDVRIVAATNRRLSDEVAAGRFRADLYYRLQVVDIALQPLREHKDDIPDLLRHFVLELAPVLGVEPIEARAEELALLRDYHWPGNVRELRNLVERSLILGALNVSALYPSMPGSARAAGGPRPTDLQTLEKQHIQAVLASVQGDKTRAAQLLGVSRRTLERRVAEWGQRDHPDT